MMGVQRYGWMMEILQIGRCVGYLLAFMVGFLITI
jgi:hypothetical protein